MYATVWVLCRICRPREEPLSAGRVEFTHLLRLLNKRGYIRTWYVYKIFFFIFRLMRYSYVCFFSLLDTTTSGKATDMIAGICTFPRLPCPSTKRHVMLNLTSAAAAAAAATLRTPGWPRSVFSFSSNSLAKATWWWICWCTEPSETFRVRPSYGYEKKHVSRDSKMCCCCCRFCCCAPTTDERIHAPVLHDVSQIDYCRYWGRAILPPITSCTALFMIISAWICDCVSTHCGVLMANHTCYLDWYHVCIKIHS